MGRPAMPSAPLVAGAPAAPRDLDALPDVAHELVAGTGDNIESSARKLFQVWVEALHERVAIFL